MIHFEGLVTSVYRDQAAIPTVCVGHVVKPEDASWIADGVTRDECNEVLARDLGRFEAAVNRLVKVRISQPMFDALISLVYNIGEGALATSTVLRELNAGHYSAAADGFLLWQYVRVPQRDGSVRKLPILAGRREAEAALFRSGIGEVLGIPSHTEPSLESLVRVAQLQFAESLPDYRHPENDDEPPAEEGSERMAFLPPDEETATAA